MSLSEGQCSGFLQTQCGLFIPHMTVFKWQSTIPMTTVCTKWIQPSSHIDSIQWKICICEACSIIFTAYIDCFMHWIHPNSPISASKVAHLKYANKSRHDCWFPLNFLFRHGQTEITEVFCRKPLALLPPSAGPHFIWIINDKSCFFSSYTEALQLLMCFSVQGENGAVTEDCCLSL